MTITRGIKPMEKMAANIKVDFNRLGPSRDSTMVVVGGCGGMGRSVVKAANASGVKVTVFAAATFNASNLDLVPEVVTPTVVIFAPVIITSSLSSDPAAVTLSRVKFAEV